MSALIEAQDLRVLFRQGRTRIRALDGVSIRIGEGEIFGLLGPNGAGKSTAMYCCLGLLRPDGGRISVLGQTPEPGAALFDDIAYLPEEPHYHPYLSVWEAVRYYASLYRRRLADAEVTAAIDAVGLGEFRRLRIARCSKGMKQKVGLATCMLFTPRLLFLDEPTRGLDPIMVRDFRDHLLRLHGLGTTIVLNSHILSEVEMVCTRVAIIDRGHLLVDDSIRNLIHSQDDAYEVLLAGTATLPPVVSEIQTVPGGLRGIVKLDDLEAFVRYCRTSGIRLLSCRARTETLEDVFMRIVKERRP